MKDFLKMVPPWLESRIVTGLAVLILAIAVTIVIGPWVFWSVTTFTHNLSVENRAEDELGRYISRVEVLSPKGPDDVDRIRDASTGLNLEIVEISWRSDVVHILVDVSDNGFLFDTGTEHVCFQARATPRPQRLMLFETHRVDCR
ncbi:hypothetical protein [Rhizohabitans arisaemae]|uniref:hypothetical protein n=1 Tax=Rhizohabitans arisaemae TaxID=2720610 RepID=UPI0024B1B899|nr:hypothetical protein [Rhizohabitans arisaemae]